MNCVVCGKEISKSQFSSVVLCSDECFYDWFWIGVIKDTSKNKVIIDGGCYIICDEFKSTADRGFGGREFKIQMMDSPNEIIYTTNLWFKGEVPEKFQKDLPNNAKFLKIGMSV